MSETKTQGTRSVLKKGKSQMKPTVSHSQKPTPKVSCAISGLPMGLDTASVSWNDVQIQEDSISKGTWNANLHSDLNGLKVGSMVDNLSIVV